MSEYFNWENKIKSKELKKCCKAINENKVIIFPTETVYGIGAKATSKQAIEQVYIIKQRPKNKPVNIMVSSRRQIKKYAYIQNKLEKEIIKKFMPGPITIILEKKSIIPDIVTSGNSKIGIRNPDNRIAQKILKKCKTSIIASSANISGEESEQSVEKLKEIFEGKVDIIIKGKTQKEGKASTIVEVVDNKIVIHRQGKITKEEIEQKIK